MAAPPSANPSAVATGPAMFVEVSDFLSVAVAPAPVSVPVSVVVVMVVASLLDDVVVPVTDADAAETRLE